MRRSALNIESNNQQQQHHHHKSTHHNWLSWVASSLALLLAVIFLVNYLPRDPATASETLSETTTTTVSSLYTTSSPPPRDMAGKEEESAVSPATSTMAGGISSPSSHAPEDLQDPAVIAAAQFALWSLKEAPDSYSFKSTALAVVKESPAGGAPPTLIPRVVQMARQVVQGLNYFLVIELVQPQSSGEAASAVGTCVGAFGVVVWDRFGELILLRWGQEVPCDQANAMWMNDQDFMQIFPEQENPHQK